MTHLLCLAAALLLSACVGESGVYIASSHSLDKDCKCNSSEQQSSGLIDLSLANTYNVCLRLKNDLAGDDEDTVGSQRNYYQLRSLIIETRVDGDTVAEEELDIAGGCPPNGELLLTGAGILGPKSLEALNSMASQDFQSAVVRVKVKGKLLSGGYIVTTPYSFPIDFMTSGSTATTSCDDGFTLTSNAEESGADLCPLEGQNNVVYYCKEDEDKDEGTN